MTDATTWDGEVLTVARKAWVERNQSWICSDGLGIWPFETDPGRYLSALRDVIVERDNLREEVERWRGIQAMAANADDWPTHPGAGPPGRWRCSCCGEAGPDIHTGLWRQTDTAWEHACEQNDPQAGHMPCVRVDLDMDASVDGLIGTLSPQAAKKAKPTPESVARDLYALGPDAFYAVINHLERLVGPCDEPACIPSLVEAWRREVEGEEA